MSKHPPGPWRQCQANDGHCICGLIWSIPADVIVAQMSTDEDSPPVTSDEAIANAALIAAVPDMLAALEDESHVSTAWMLDWVADRMVKVYGESENVDFVQSIRKRAALCRAALQKAKGTP
jgi:hypothetical protein